MKGNAIMIAFALLVLAVAIGLVIWMNADSAELLGLCTQIESKTLNGDDSAARDIEHLKQLWQKESVSWQYVAIHDDMHQVSDALISMAHSYQKGDKQDVLLYGEMFRTAVSSLMEKELPTLRNIF